MKHISEIEPGQRLTRRSTKYGVDLITVESVSVGVYTISEIGATHEGPTRTVHEIGASALVADYRAVTSTGDGTTVESIVAAAGLDA